MKKLKKLIKKEWSLRYKTIDKDLTLIGLAEQIAMDSESCTREEAYGMYIDQPQFHLPGIIALIITDGLGVDETKVNVHMTLDHLFSLLKK
jgi:hypothetical protein